MRSWLFVPADSERKLAKGLTTGADALILDLEDAVAAERRPVARQMASEFMASARSVASRSKLYVRINPLDSTDWEADLAGVMGAAPDGIILPKPRSGEDVHRLSIALGHAEAKTGLPAGQTRILSIVTEVPISVLRLETYVGASARQIALSWGAEDLGAVIGSSANREKDNTFTSPYMLVRNLCLITAVAAEVEPIDTVFVNFRDQAGLREEALIAKRDGFTGKIAIHPDQVAVINEVFTPTAGEIAHAQEVAAAFAASPGIGVVGLRGMMLDMPHLKLAERVLSRAKAAGAVG